MAHYVKGGEAVVYSSIRDVKDVEKTRRIVLGNGEANILALLEFYNESIVDVVVSKPTH